MTRRAVRLLVAVTALTTLAAACSSGGGTTHGAVQKIGAKYINMSAADVRPPVGPDTQTLALPGFIVATNSVSWTRIIGSPSGVGAVVLFVQPGGPTDNKGIARGDLLVKVDGTPVANAERAIAVLHSRVGQKRVLSFIRSGRKGTRDVTILGRSPRGNPMSVVSAELQNNPNDPVLSYLRAYIGGTNQQRLNDLAKALQEKPDFVDALQLRASIIWTASFGIKDATQRRQYQTQALAGWQNALTIDPRNATTLAVRSVAETDLGTPRSGEQDANRALNIDASQPLALFALSHARSAENHLSEALGPALGAVELQPYNLDYWKNLATLFVKNKRKADCTKTADAFTPYLRARQGQAFIQAANDLQKVCR
jgi:membrane-associated protease RseP (regulator of RpoE activity)